MIKKAVAFQSSRDGVSEFLKRRGEDFPGDTWAQVKIEQVRRFADRRAVRLYGS